MIGLIAANLVVAGLLSAQRAPAAAVSPPPPPEQEPVNLPAVVVTGSNIPSTESASAARTFPVATIDRKLIDESGITGTAELLQRMSFSNGNSVPLSNNAIGYTPGASSTSLRGLGSDATLVLVNGRRMPFYPVGAGGTIAFVDLNTIPLEAVERVEVLKDGASAVYGADAVAGVVNIILRHGFDGTSASVRYGNTTNKDSSEFKADLLYGVTRPEGSLMVGINAYNRNSIFHRDRTYSAVPVFLSSNASPPNLQVSRAAVLEALGLPPGSSIPGVDDSASSFFATSGPNLFNSLDPAPGNQNANNHGNVPANLYTFSPYRLSSYNYNESASSYPEIHRRGGFVSWDRRFGAENLRMYGDLFFQRFREIDELAPYATNNFESPGQTTIVIPARTPNPILTPAEIASGHRTAAPGAYNPFNPFNQDISGGSRTRLSEWGNRVFEIRNTAVAGTAGIRADNLLGKWNFDAGVRYGEVEDDMRIKLISTSRFLQILNAADPIFNPASPNYIGTTIPYNPFGYYKNPIASNQAAVDYATHYQHDENRSRLFQATFLLNTTELFSLRSGAVGFAVGAEFRREAISQAPDSALNAGDILGKPPKGVTVAQRKVGSYHAEAEIPLVGGDRSLDFARLVSVNVSARYEDFLTSGRNAFVPKFGLRWEPLADGSLVLRGSWGKGFREPSLFELFSGRTTGTYPVTDPLTGTTEFEQSVTVAGNRSLDAEDSESRNFGIVWSPRGRLRGLTASFDLWRITREGTPSYSFQQTINRAVGHSPDGKPVPGGLLGGESVLRSSTGEVVQVNSVFLNSGEIIADGFDASASYSRSAGALGRFEVGASATYLGSFRYSSLPGSALVEAVDATIPGTSGDDAYVRWKGQAFAGWSWNDIQTRVTGNYVDGFDDTGGDAFGNYYGAMPFRVKSTWTVDLQLSYRLAAPDSSRRSRWLSDYGLTVGVNNLLDEDPPFVSDWGANANGYPGYLYTDVGRFVYISIEKKL